MKFNFERKEVKYLITPEQWEKLLSKGYFKPDNYDKAKISNIYYDTDSFELIRRSIEKPTYKEKLRVRVYGECKERSPAFVEIKKKNNGIVYKRRIVLPYTDAINFLDGEFEVDSQIAREIKAFQKRYKNLSPKIVLNYERQAFVFVNDPDIRVTIDKNIKYRTENLDLLSENNEVVLPEFKDKYIMEIKIKRPYPLHFSKLLSELSIFPLSFSKYGYIFTHADKFEKFR